MHPALSVIFFTTLSGAGYGLLAWLGVSLMLLQVRGTSTPELQRAQLVALALGLLLSTIGLLCSLAHLGKPMRAWRALSQWRTSWLSREGVMSVATLLPAVLLVFLLRRAPGAEGGPLLAALGMLLVACAMLTVVCTAMIYASLKPVPDWRHPLVVPAYLLFALVTGLALQFVVISYMFGGQDARPMLLTLSVLGVLTVAMKWLYWHETDRARLPVTRGDAVGLPQRKPAVFERPHTEANYITREMAFTVARTHATRLRLAATALIAGGPLLAMLLAGSMPPTVALALAAVLLLAGAFVERWLFFAQARHMVTLYY